MAPAGERTRPTADRVRQALFDMLMHASWGGRAVIDGAFVLDAFAGTGSLGLEALSRGAARACFIENDPAALRALQANVLACGAGERAWIARSDVLAFSAPAFARQAGEPAQAGLVFLDPPYGHDLVARAIRHLIESHIVASGALVVAELGRHETWVPEQELLADRPHGAARILIFRLP